MNVRSLMPKLPELHLWMSSHNPSVLGLTETWLHPGVDSSELHMPGYTLFRSDRIGSPHGGAALYIANDLNPSLTLCQADADGKFELILVRTHPSGTSPIHFGVVYRSPVCRSISWLDTLQDFSQHGNLCLMGDFNCPNICWDSLTTTSGATQTDAELLDFSVNQGLTQLVHTPTRPTTTSNSCLDLLFTSSVHSIGNVRLLEPLSTSDHSTILADLRLPPSRGPPCPPTRNFWKVDVGLLRSMANTVPWQNIVDSDFEDSWSRFKQAISTLTSKCVPVSTPSKGIRRPPWITRDLNRLLKARRRAWKAFSSSGSPRAYDTYKLLRNRCNSQIRRSRARYEANLLDHADTQPKRFFAYVNRRRRRPCGLPCLESSTGITVHDDSNKANLLADHFSAIYPQEQSDYSPPAEDDTSDIPPLTDLSFTLDDVASLLRQLDPSKATGPDELHPIILKYLADILAPAVFSLFRQSLDQGYLPSDWKHGIIRPIHKSGNPSLPSNYRPICLTSILVKTLEKLIRAHLDRHLSAHNLLPPNQHGFVPGKSCITNLLLARETWAGAWDRHTSVHAISVDFSQAFDRVNHQTLLRKIHSLHINGKVFTWIAAYLRDRTWQVRVGSDISHPVTATSGVPQGAVLGPRLFTIYVSDIARNIQSPTLLFADDLKIWREITSPMDQLLLQNDLHRLMHWALCNDLPINPQKSTFLNMTPWATPSTPYYWLGCSAITPSATVKDLGVFIASNFSTTSHTESVRRRALNLIWMLKRSLATWTPSFFRKVFTTLIRPILEYGAPAYFPCTKGEIDRLEYVQRLGTRFIPRIRRWDYPERYADLKLFSLEYRRTRADLILMFRVVVLHQYPDLQHLLVRSTVTHTRGHPFKLEVLRSDNIAHDIRWSRRRITTWNLLPTSVVSASTVAAFKSRLDDHLSPFAFGGTSLRGKVLVAPTV